MTDRQIDMEKIRVFTAFSGYDSQCLSLDRLKKKYPEFDYELVGWSEIDKYAIQAHNAIYPQWADRNYGDWDEVPDFDLFTYSSPCQDFSNAGLQRGGVLYRRSLSRPSTSGKRSLHGMVTRILRRCSTRRITACRRTARGYSLSPYKAMRGTTSHNLLS